jgi:IclR family pca regulon transcriptional regulator
LAAITPSAARRFLLTLEVLGYVERKGRNFRLTPKTVTLGLAYLEANEWWRVAQPYLTRASEALNETIATAIRDGKDIIHVMRSPAPGLMKVNFNIGRRFPAAATAMGRVLLAELSREQIDQLYTEDSLPQFTPKTVRTKTELNEILADVREKGYAFIDQELEMGLVSLAVPLRSRSGEVVAATNVTVYSGRLTEKDMVASSLSVLRHCADEISVCLGK